MAITGDIIPQVLFLFDASGVELTYASKALFTGAGWALTWYDNTGVALSTQPTYTMVAGDANGRHQFNFIMPGGLWTCKITRPSVLYLPSPAEFSGEGQAYDEDSLGSALAVAAGFTINDATTTSTATMFDGDSIYLDFEVVEDALTRIGAPSLAACTIAAEIKRTSENSSAAADVTTLVETITSDTAGNRVVHGALVAFPSILQPLSGGLQTLACRADLRLTYSSKTIIASTIDITVKWKATT